MKIYPIHIETLVLGEGDHTIANISEDYVSLKYHPGGEELEAKNFRKESMPEKQGVCLHFILPDEWKHGEQMEDGSISYWKLPNRWSITRYAVYEERGRRSELARKDWIVESNLLKEKKDATLRGVTIGYEDSQKPWRILGEQREYDGKITTEGIHLENLTAASRGIDYFTGYYPECRSVIGFYDSIHDLKVIEKGEEKQKRYLLTYAVAGWYEGEDESQKFRMCHGYVTNLCWFGKNYRYDSGIPKKLDMPRVVVGNSAEEAVAALLSYYSGKKEDEELLKYLFYQALPELEKLDGLHYGRRKVRQGKFVPVASEKQIVIEGEDVRYTEKKMELLKRIEELRREREQNVETQRELYQKIYLMWVKASGWDKKYSQEAYTRILELKCRICKLQEEYRKRYAQEIEEDLKKQLKGLLQTGEELKEIAGEHYFQPSDYTILLEGAAQSNIYREIEQCMEDGKTPYREAVDIIDKVWVQVKNDGKDFRFEFTYSDLEMDAPAKILLPDTAELLAREAGLISRGTIYYLAENILGRMDVEKTALNMTHVVQSYEESLEKGIGNKKMPSLIGRFLWRPSWNPLFLEWNLLYSKKDSTVLNKDIGIQGRSVLSSTSADSLLNLFEKYAEEEGYLSYITKLRSMRVLSQKLSGVHDALLTRTKNVLVYPKGDFPKEIMRIVREAFANLPDGYLDRNRVKGREKEPLEEFEDIREGVLKLLEMGSGSFRIIDSFGRTLDYSAQELIISNEISKKTIGKEFEAERRILAPLRIRTTWEYIRKSLGDEEVSPIYGWLWPNLIDSSLHIYRSDGMFVGTVQAYYIGGADGEKRVKIALRNPSGMAEKETELIQKNNSMLRDFLEEFLRVCIREPETFFEMLKLLDDSMWNIREGNVQKGSNSCAWLGHPVALAGVQVSVEMKGNPPQPIFYHDESYDSKLLSMEYKIKMGASECQKDGVIGFYEMAKEGFTKIHYCANEEYQSSYYDSDMTASLHLNTPEEFIFLLSPYGEITLDMEILPVKSIKLNEKLVEKALETIFMVIYSAPFLTQKGEIQLLTPGGLETEWKFMEIPEPGRRGELREITTPPMEAGQQEINQEIKEGWLALEATKRRAKNDDKK